MNATSRSVRNSRPRGWLPLEERSERASVALHGESVADTTELSRASQRGRGMVILWNRVLTFRRLTLFNQLPRTGPAYARAHDSPLVDSYRGRGAVDDYRTVRADRGRRATLSLNTFR